MAFGFGVDFSDYLRNGTWDSVKGYLVEELQQLRGAIASKWGSVFNSEDNLQATAFAGNTNDPPVYVALDSLPSQGGEPMWDKVDVASGVKNRLHYAHLTAPTSPNEVLGRAATPGDWEPINVGSGLQIAGNNLEALAIAFCFDGGGGGGDSEPGPPGTTGATGATGATGPAGATGGQGQAGVPDYWFMPDDPEFPLMIPGPVGTTGATGSTGGQGQDGLPGMFIAPDDPEFPMIVPGQQGLAGPAGSSILLYADASVPSGNTISNATSGTFTSSYTFPANNILVGDVYRLLLSGVYGTTGTPNLTLNCKFASTSMWNTGAITMPSTVTNQGWWAESWFVVTGVGSSGSVEVQAYESYESAATTALTVHTPNTAPITLNTTVANAVTVAVTWSSGVSANTITCREFILEKIVSSAARTGVIGVVIDGQGASITAGVKGFLHIPVNCTITGMTMLSIDALATSGSIVVDIWKTGIGSYPPTVANTITASALPTLSSANKVQDFTLTGWTKSITAGDVLGFNVNSATTVTKVILELQVSITG